MHTRPVWVEISRRNLIANYHALRAALQHQTAPPGHASGQGVVLAVVKANAYGHGLDQCAPALVEAGAEWIGVTSVEEALQARRLCADASILVMSGLWHGEADAVIEHRLTPVVWEGFHLDLLETAAFRRGLPPRSVPVHVELDTGMARQGVRPGNESFDGFLRRFQPSSPLRFAGLATHFSSPEVLASEETSRQVTRFVEAIAIASSAGLAPDWVHAGNSATLLSGEPLDVLARAAAQTGARLMVRPGLSLYGYHPRFEGSGPGSILKPVLSPNYLAGLLPVLSWKTRVASLRVIESGEPVGYNTTFRATRRSRLALLPVGYADGLNRLLSNCGTVLIGGARAPVVGRISMDQTVVDVTDLEPVNIGDEVVILGSQQGSQGALHTTAWDLADLAATIPYEVLCAIAARVARVAVD